MEAQIRRLIYTSVDDCRVSLDHIQDLPLLQEVLTRLQGVDGQVSRRQVVERRIRQLLKEAQKRAGL